MVDSFCNIHEVCFIYHFLVVSRSVEVIHDFTIVLQFHSLNNYGWST